MELGICKNKERGEGGKVIKGKETKGKGRERERKRVRELRKRKIGRRMQK